MKRLRGAVRGAVGFAWALLAGCTSPPDATPAPGATARPAAARDATALQPGLSTAADVLQRWGEPQGRTVFQQGHAVWHYYHPLDGWAWQSWLPGVHLVSAERGRRAVEHVLLFDARGLLVQRLTRELP